MRFYVILKMETCFVIQPFDGGTFDKRYLEIIEPAIQDAGLIAYRVDQDPSVDVPIDDIENGIRKARICLAEISKDNPNVWYELGFSLACEKSVILICSEDRKKFPFDIQHRTIIRYKNDSITDFNELKSRITQRAIAILKKEKTLKTLSNNDLAPIDGLNQQEMAVLVALAGNLESPEDRVDSHVLRADVEKAGFTKVAAIIGIKGLSKKELIDYNMITDDYKNGEYLVYSLTHLGWDWIMENQERFVIVNNPDYSVPF